MEFGLRDELSHPFAPPSSPSTGCMSKPRSGRNRGFCSVLLGLIGQVYDGAAVMNRRKGGRDAGCRRLEVRGACLDRRTNRQGVGDTGAFGAPDG